jgi:hypothetical protein
VQPLKILGLVLGGLVDRAGNLEPRYRGDRLPAARDAVQGLDKHKDQLKQQVQDKLQNLFK